MEDLESSTNATAAFSSSLFPTTTTSTTLNLWSTPLLTDATVDVSSSFPLLLLEQSINNSSPPSSISSGTCSASSAEDEADVMPTSSSASMYTTCSMPNRQSSAGVTVASEAASANTSPWISSGSMTPYQSYSLPAHYAPSSTAAGHHHHQQQQQQHPHDPARFSQTLPSATGGTDDVGKRAPIISSSDRHARAIAPAGVRRNYQAGSNVSPMYAYAGQAQENEAENASAYAYTVSHSQSFQGVPAFSPTFGAPQTSQHESGVASCLCRAFGQDTCTCGASTAMKPSSKNVSMNGSGDYVPIGSYPAALTQRATNPTTTPASTGTTSTPHSFTLPAVRPSGVAATYGASQSSVPLTGSSQLATSPFEQLSTSLPSTYTQSGHVFGGQTVPGLPNVSPTYNVASSAALRTHASPNGVWNAQHHAAGDFQSSFFQHQSPFTPALTTASSGGSLMGMEMYERGSSYPLTPRGSNSTGGMAVGGFANQPPSMLSEIDDCNGRINASKYTTEEGRWDAVLRRSHSADSHFVYAALTTRIYCRPSCASKRPDRGRVQFFSFPDAAAKAEASGFRACKRCKPGTPGTADVCVLAVGECLRHMTRAALLGESDEVDMRLKRRTLKQYSNDYGVSAFHFHRTLKNVCTLTPGEYSKAAHSLVLQDELGIDRYGRPLEPEELSARLRGWSTRRARRALGNVLPHSYASGLPDVPVRFVVADKTPFGRVVVLLALGQQASHSPLEAATVHNASSEASLSIAVLGVLIGEDAVQRATTRCPRAVRDDDRSIWLVDLVNALVVKGTREVQMPREVIPWVRRARVYLAAKNALEQSSTRSQGGIGSGHTASYHGLKGEGGHELDLVDDGFDDEEFE